MFIRKYKYNMSELDCMEKYWGCCDSSISTSKFYEFSANKRLQILKQVDLPMKKGIISKLMEM